MSTTDSPSQTGAGALFALFPALRQYGPEEDAARNLGFRKKEFIYSSEDIISALKTLPFIPSVAQSSLSQGMYHASRRYELSEVQIKVVESIRSSLQKDSPAIFWLTELINDSRKDIYRTAQAMRKSSEAKDASVQRDENSHPEAKFFSNRATVLPSPASGAVIQNRFVRANKATV